MEKNQIEKKKTCFIVCPISEENSDTRKRSDKLMKYLIDPVCKELNFNFIRIDKVSHNNSITEEIFKHLNEAELVISDITEHNPNCFYESGYRAALGKPLIFIKNKDVKIPFDIANTRIYDYDLDVEAAEEFKKSLKENIELLNFTTSEKKENSSKAENDTLAKIFNSLLNIYGKIEDLSKENKAVASSNQVTLELLKFFSNKAQSFSKSEDEIILEFFKELMKHPDAIKKIKELEKIVK
ncbi:MAG: hypothetical protein Q4A58_03925 [Fusobacterium sp.]|uniref:hypothetical protein n=1 Tax=Fusobacterium sp. TaxID=68766 RepID=UPI0026DBBD20|nr:hypothetical protein [Fusobacterium sp.]MDO4690426.1 hypothetical protein [Fusobacterium sp.]